VRGRRTVTGRLGPELTRRMGVCTVIGCAGWFVFATRVLIPHFSSAGAFTESLFGNLGATPTDMVRTAVSDPAIVRQHLELSNPVEYFRQLTGSFGFVALLSPLMLLVAIPQAAINLLAVYNFFWVTNVHYAALPLLAVAIASIEGVARFRREGVRRFLLGAVAIGAFFTCVSWGISPFSASYRAGFWPLEPIPNQQLLDDVVALPGPDEAVSAMYNLVPHLTHRNEAYTFPNPWIPLNWGVEGENRPNPTDVDWILVNPAALSDADGGALVSAITQPDRLYKPGEQAKPPADKVYGMLVDRTKWRVVIDQPSMLALHRVRA
jgi:uncharacterized membrane protein